MIQDIKFLIWIIIKVSNEQELHQTLRQNVHKPSNPDHLADTGIKDQKSLSVTYGCLSANGLKAGT